MPLPVSQRALVLASASPRRREILAQLGLQFRVLESGVDEPAHAGEAPSDYAAALAERKAAAVSQRLAARAEDAFVLGADTIVVIDGGVLGKPSDEEDAFRMLRSLAGRTHEVITAVALGRSGDGQLETLRVSSRVTFRALGDDSLRRYVASGEGRDKAGSYAVQGLGAGLVQAIEGSYSNVVGLPACETLELLLRAGAVLAWP